MGEPTDSRLENMTTIVERLLDPRRKMSPKTLLDAGLLHGMVASHFAALEVEIPMLVGWKKLGEFEYYYAPFAPKDPTIQLDVTATLRWHRTLAERNLGDKRAVMLCNKQRGTGESYRIYLTRDGEFVFYSGRQFVEGHLGPTLTIGKLPSLFEIFELGFPGGTRPFIALLESFPKALQDSNEHRRTQIEKHTELESLLSAELSILAS